jgi:protein TonB
LAANSLPVPGLSPHSTGARAEAARTPRVEIVVVSGDDVLLEQVGQALDGESTIRQADGLAEARAQLKHRQPAVVLLDARSQGGELAQAVEELQSPDGIHIVVVFAPAEQSSEIARAIRGSAAFAVLPIPVVPAQAAAIIEGAREESLSRHALLSTAAPVVTAVPAAAAPVLESSRAPAPEPFVEPRSHPARAQSAPPTDGSKRKLYVGAAGLALLVLAAAGYFWQQSSKQPAVQSTPQPAPAEAITDAAPVVVEEALQAGSVEELLDSARAAMRERRYTDPEGNNALNYYRSVLAQEADNGEAREGLQRIAAVLQQRVQSALQEHRIDEATRTYALLRTLRPDDPSLAPLEAALAEARFRKALEDADVRRAQEVLRQASKSGALPAAETARMQSELDRRQSVAQADQLADLVSLRIRQGRLIDPAGDSAKYYLSQLRRLPPDAKDLAATATTELQQAYLGKFRDALGRSQRTETERWKNEARALGVTANEIAAIQREVTAQAAVADSRQEAASVAQKLQGRLAEGKLLEPAGDSAMAYRDALRSLDASSSALATAERDLSAKLLERARGAVAQRQFDVARTHVVAARQLGLDLDGVAAVEKDIAAASTAAETTTRPAPAPRLTRIRYVPPEYPKAALAKHLEGDVRLRLSVDAEGRVIEAIVVQSNPAGIFDEAAIAAARQWRFKPIGKKGSGIEANATVDIVFQPQDARP